MEFDMRFSSTDFVPELLHAESLPLDSRIMKHHDTPARHLVFPCQNVHANKAANGLWCAQLAEILGTFVNSRGTLLEVGCGEATTLAGVLNHLPAAPTQALGFDISWSRCVTGLEWLKNESQRATLFVADLFAIPLATGSVDVVYTSHSLEPNGGREEPALLELLRVARRAVVLFEPLYELASSEAMERMRSHGYVRNLKATAERLGGRITDYRLLPHHANPLNPSGVLVIEKETDDSAEPAGSEKPGGIAWRCPFSHAPMRDQGDIFFSAKSGLAYPCMRRIPLLRPEHAVVASAIGRPIAGVPPKYLPRVLGHKASRALERGTPLDWDSLE